MANQPSDLGSWMIFLFSILLYSGLSSTEELRFTVEPKNVIVVKDRPFIWDCQAEGEAPINITWKKNGQIIENNERHNVLRNGSLFFVRIERKKTKITDEGQYECVARNGDGAITAIADLQVATLSKFQSHLQNPKPVTASLGGVARFECHVDSLPPAVISWEKDKDPIPSNNRFVVLPSGVLQIHNIQESDAANYRCIAVNIANKRRSAEAPLTVQSTMPPTNEPDPDRKPIIVQGPKPETKEEGDTIVLECLVVRYSPDDPEPEVTWNRLGGSAINSDLGVPYGKNNLLISNLGMTSTGVYKCTATNPATGGAVSKTARITVLVPPRLLDVPESQAKLVGVTARFPCVAEGVPPPSITWYHNAQPVVMNGRFQNPSNNDDLVITNIWKNPHESDEGIYQCVAENVRGRVQASAQLTIIKVESTPSQPRNLQAFAYSSTEITVTWDHPEELSSIMAYNVLYRLTAGGSDKEVAVEGSKSICVLEILQPYTNYTIHIIPYVTSGAGDPSNYITVQTLEDIPDKAPEFTLSSNTPSSIIITWGPLEKEHAKGNIISYRIYYRYADNLDEPVLQVDVGGHIREYVLENLEPSTTYEVKMSASTSVGEGVMSQSWNSRTTPEFLDYNIPQAPLLYLWKVNSSAVQVQWSMHSVNVPTPVLGFKLYYALASNINDLAGPVMLPSNVTSYTLSGLLPSTSYFVLLLAYNDYGDGHDASRYIETLVPTPSINIPVNPAPPYPNEIDAIVETPSTILVKWSKPQTSLEIIYYTVRFHPAAITNASLVKKEESNTEQIMLMDLIPFTEYVIAVKAHARSSESRFSNDITANTPEDRTSRRRHKRRKCLQRNRRSCKLF
ncbi:protogenin precursor [Saccoglossus kowalevskii]|uniref:Protogenin n=1 Tax=Saccoglossus kowalevskii TaxID=10224 RepID=D2XNJ9_SACKO|nr:protogenin precursor [Saccoglossus kowalevskii]ADB22629.1 protogenin [Saccoglossus kowalevskii]